MALNLDADVGQIIKNLLQNKAKAAAGKGGDNKFSFSLVHYKKAIMKCVIIVCATLSISAVISMLFSSSIKRDDSEFANLADMRSAVVKIEQDTASSKALLQNNRKKVEEILPLFSDSNDSKRLFKLISTIAERNNLVVKNLSQGEILEVTTPAKHYHNKIALEISGYYRSYMNFKKELEQQAPILHIENELIKLDLNKAGERKIDITLGLIDYSVPKSDYEKILGK